MKILVTGAKGFIGKNLISELKNQGYHSIMLYDKDTSPDLLSKYCETADFVFNLAGVNRPKNESDFMTGNFGFASILLNELKKHGNKCPVMFSSSIQADLDNVYGKSKRAGEELFFEYGRNENVKVSVYRFPNVFGKWCRPNYNSVIATFCHNISRNIPIKINDPNAVMNLVYIDDVINELVNALKGKANKVGKFCEVPTTHRITLGKISELIYSFAASRETLCIPDMSNTFIKKLYSTYLSYLPTDNFSYALKSHCDFRGSFTEIIKTVAGGQVSINISKPGIIKGNHWHHTKNEKFVVVYGKGVVRFRNIYSEEIIEYYVSGQELEVIDIPVGYVHNIENLGNEDMITIMWANEVYNPSKTDTYKLEV